jgi:hypothetical protein
MSDTDRPRILNIGLHPDLVTELEAARERFPAVDAAEVRRGLEASRAAVDELGLEFDSFLVTHGMQVERELRQTLRSRQYALIVIGGGVWLNPAMTQLFEVLINTVMSTSPTSTLCFNTGPDTTIDAVRRWWPEPAKLPAI